MKNTNRKPCLTVHESETFKEQALCYSKALYNKAL